MKQRSVPHAAEHVPEVETGKYRLPGHTREILTSMQMLPFAFKEAVTRNMATMIETGHTESKHEADECLNACLRTLIEQAIVYERETTCRPSNFEPKCVQAHFDKHWRLIELLPISSKTNLAARLMCFNLLSSASGALIERELWYCRDHLDYRADHLKFEGLAMSELKTTANDVSVFVENLVSGYDPTTTSDELHTISYRPVHPLLNHLLADPTDLQQRVQLEAQIMYKQAAEYYEWEKAAGRCSRNDPQDTLDCIRQHPDRFVSELLRGFPGEAPTSLRHNTQTPRLREGTLPLPEFALPIALAQKLTYAERETLLDELQAELANHQSDPPTRKGRYCAHVLRGLEILHEQLGELGNTYAVPNDPPNDIVFQATQSLAELCDKQNRSPRRWTELYGATFGQDRPPQRKLGQQFIATLGFVPSALYRHKKFAEAVSFADLATLHNELHDMQESAVEADIQDTHNTHEQNTRRTLFARTTLLHHLFISGIAAETFPETKLRRGCVSIDTNGLRIDLCKRSQSGKMYHLNAHLPYAYIDDELALLLLNEEWLEPQQLDELHLQRALAQRDSLTAEAMEQKQLQRFAAALDYTGKNPLGHIILQLYSDVGRDLVQRVLLKSSHNVPQYFLPASVVREYLTEETESLRNQYTALFQLGQATQDALRRERNDALQDPRNYSVSRAILGEIVEVLSVSQVVLDELDVRVTRPYSRRKDSLSRQKISLPDAEDAAIEFYPDKLIWKQQHYFAEMVRVRRLV